MDHFPDFYLSSKCRTIKHCYDQITKQTINEPTIIQAENKPLYELYHDSNTHTKLQRNGYAIPKIRRVRRLTSTNNNLQVVSKEKTLTGSKFSIIPTVEAAPPEKPPPMKFKELSIYDSPHEDYKEYISSKDKCPEYGTNIMLNTLLPHVKDTRETVYKYYDVVKDYYEQVKCHVNYYICQMNCKKDHLVYEARKDDNLQIRRGVVIASGIAGFLLGRRLGSYKDSVIKGLLLSGAGVLAAGALCFPEETDERFRNFCYYTASVVVKVYNVSADDNKVVDRREDTLPCSKDMALLKSCSGGKSKSITRFPDYSCEK